MSYEAVAWALSQEISHSSAKFVLVVMAHHADKETWESFPSSASIAKSTGQDRKTVIANITRLRELGFIVDTEKRVGDTKQIPVYLLNSTKNGPVKEDSAEADGNSNSSENGILKQSQKRNSSENGTVPNFPGNSTVFPANSTVFPGKQSQKRDTERSSKDQNKSGNIKPPVTEIPDWVPMDAWKAFVEMRQRIKKPMTEYAKKLALKELQDLVDNGQDAEKVINQSVLKSWQGFFAVKAANGTVNKHGGFGNQDYRAGVTDDGLF